MRYILKKLGVVIVTLIVISALAFVAFQIIPGDPATKMLGSEATPESVASLREELGLNRPVYLRYFEWLAGFLSGNFGRSYSFNMPVTELIGNKIPVTAVLSLMAFVFVVAISIPMGIFLARFEGGAVDRIMTVINQVNMSIPPFFTGIIFSHVFGLAFKLFRPGDFMPYSESVGGFFINLIFPALAIALPKSAMVIKLLRGSILGEMSSDYVRTAYSRGNSRWDVLKRHVLRNAIIPVITFLAISLADIVAGSIIIEQVFSIPGLGRMLLLSISNRDFPVVQAIVVMIAALVVIVNFIADVAYQYIDPRIQLS